MELRAAAAGVSWKCCRPSPILIQRTTLHPRLRIALGSRSPQVLNNATPIGCCFKSSRHQLFLGSLKRRPITLQLRATGGEVASVKSGAQDKSREDGSSGTVLGAASLIIGTSVGSGILALPQKTSPAGFLPSTASIIICWAFLVVEALLVAEVNVSLTRMRRRSWKEAEENVRKEGKEEEASSPTTISFKTMAQETLGELGGSMATITYVFLGYTSMIAYTSESGELLSHLIALPSSSLSILFTAALASLIFLGGTRATDHVNQWLTALMLGLLVIIEVRAASSGDWFALMATGDWRKVPRAVPVIIFALSYHDIIPVMCSYLDGDMKRIRLSILVGSLIPVVFLLVWDGIVLGYSSRIDAIDPLELLFRGGDAAASMMAEAFSILAVSSSLIGTLLGFSNFFQEQFYSLFRSGLPSGPPQVQPLLQEDNMSRASDGDKETGVHREWMHLESVLNFSAVAVAVIPSLIVSATLADAFSVATDIAGGYCMISLFGILPPAMAWSLRMQEIDATPEESNACCANEYPMMNEEEEGERVEGTFSGKGGRGLLSDMKPALMGTVLFATVLVAEQLFEDVRSLLRL